MATNLNPLMIDITASVSIIAVTAYVLRQPLVYGNNYFTFS